MRAYIHSFLGYRLPREETGSRPAGQRRTSVAAAGDGVPPAASPVAMVPGVAETFDDEPALVPVTARNVSEVVGEEVRADAPEPCRLLRPPGPTHPRRQGVDVFLVLHRRDCEWSAHMAPYIKRVARRLRALAPKVCAAYSDGASQRREGEGRSDR